MPTDDKLLPSRLGTTLAVLAGGSGTRMGRAKSLLTISGRPILTHILANYRWAGPTLLVTAPGRTGPPGAEGFDREVVDAVADGGPLLGICTALEHFQTDLLIVATVDMPGVGPEQLEWLRSNLKSEQLGLMGSHAADGGVQIEPFPSIYRAAAAEPLRAHFASGRRSVHSILHDPGLCLKTPRGAVRRGWRPQAMPARSFQTEPRFVAKETPADWPATVWTNLNYPADVEAFGKSPPR